MSKLGEIGFTLNLHDLAVKRGGGEGAGPDQLIPRSALGNKQDKFIIQ